MRFPYLLIAFAAFSLAANSAWAVRTISSMSSVANPSSAHRVAGIMSSGRNGIAGGVILDGETTFVLETSAGDEEIKASEIRLDFEQDEVVVLWDQARFTYDMHEALACPLARLVARGGEIVYSLPHDGSESAAKQLRSQGLVQPGNLGPWVAREFDSSALILLLHGMDFAEEVRLPSDLENSIRSSVNRLTGAGSTTTNDWASYFNTAAMSNITAFVSKDTGSVEMAGIPLRFYWEVGPSGSDVISDVTAYSQELGSQSLTDLDAIDLGEVEELTPVDFLLGPTLYFNQIDYLSAYQSAALFRTVHSQDSDAFAEFTLRACQG